jgi:hypothetical protein
MIGGSKPAGSCIDEERSVDSKGDRSWWYVVEC